MPESTDELEVYRVMFRLSACTRSEVEELADHLIDACDRYLERGVKVEASISDDRERQIWLVAC